MQYQSLRTQTRYINVTAPFLNLPGQAARAAPDLSTDFGAGVLFIPICYG